MLVASPTPDADMPRSRLAALLITALLALQACGGGGDDAAGSGNSGAGGGSGGGSTPTTPTTPGSPTTPTGADITCGFANFQSEALRLINARRAAGASCGTRGSFAPAPALAWNAALANAAYGHSLDMATQNYFAHDSLDGRSLGTRVTAAGYSWSTVGENIAAGYATLPAVIDGWMTSDGHCANLMSASFTEVGLACARNSASTYGIYWTQNLGRPR